MSTHKYLDETGLGQVWSKIKGLIPESDIFLVTMTQDQTSSTGYRSNKTYNEVVSAINAGKTIVGTCLNSYFTTYSVATNSIQFIYTRTNQVRQYSLPKDSTEVIYTTRNIQIGLTFDSTPTENSTNPVTSGGVYTALANAGSTPDWDENDTTSSSYIQNRTHHRESLGDTIHLDLFPYLFHSDELWEEELTINGETYTVYRISESWLDAAFDPSWFPTHTIDDYDLSVTSSVLMVDGVSKTLTHIISRNDSYWYGDALYAYNNEYILVFVNNYCILYHTTNDLPTTSLTYDLKLSNEIFEYFPLDNRYINGTLIINGTYDYSEIFNGLEYQDGFPTKEAMGSGSHVEGIADGNSVWKEVRLSGQAGATTYSDPDFNYKRFENVISGKELYIFDDYSLSYQASGIFVNYCVPPNKTIILTETLNANSDISNEYYYIPLPNSFANSGAHAEGNNTYASGSYSHAEGNNTTASGSYSHAEGGYTTASGASSHAEGSNTTASGSNSHAEGNNTTASGSYSHAEGNNTTASGSYSHAEGRDTTASGSNSHAEGYTTNASGDYSHAEGGYTTASGASSHAEGRYTCASGSYSHAEGYNATASGSSSHAEGGTPINDTITSNKSIYLTGAANATTYTVNSYSLNGERLNLIGFRIKNQDTIITNQTIVNGVITEITVNKTLWANACNNKVFYFVGGSAALATNSHAEGGYTTASGASSHAEGYFATASGSYSHAEGNNTTASGSYSHAEGNNTTASGSYSHAEGRDTTASGSNSHAEGYFATASGDYSHAEGYETTASGSSSHAEGYIVTASGDYSHAEGRGTTASRRSHHVFGEYNVLDEYDSLPASKGQYVEIVGNGTASNARSNARTLDWSGNEVLAGKLTVGTAPANDMDVATKKYVDDATAGITTDLSGLTDTTITTPTDGQLLKYNSTTSKWENVTLSLAISGNTIQLKEGNTVISSINLPLYNGGVSS